jgi:hypothetical protein
MTEQTNKNLTMTQYLLGSLPAAETERLDELSVSDEEFAETLRAAENDLIDAYVQQELSGETLERFNSHYLKSPLRNDRVEFAQALKGWAQKNEVKGHEEKPARTASDRSSSGVSILGLFTSPRLALQWGFAAAALVLLITAGWLVFENMRLRREVSQAHPQAESLGQVQQQLENELAVQRAANATTEQELARVRDERERLEQELNKRSARPETEGVVASLILPAPLRAAGQVPKLSIAPGTSLVATQLQLEAADYPAYRVSLIDPVNDHTLWRSGNLKPGTKAKAIKVTFHADLLKPQNYILRVAGIPGKGDAEIVGDYPFKVVK